MIAYTCLSRLFLCDLWRISRNLYSFKTLKNNELRFGYRFMHMYWLLVYRTK